MTRTLLIILAASALLSASSLAVGGPGHDHADDAPTNTANSVPRASAHSERFELVAVLERGKLVVFLDRYDDNEPVTTARLELATDGYTGVATAQTDGTYLVAAPFLEKPGTYPLIFTVQAGKESDLLAADLEIPDLHTAREHNATRMPSTGLLAIGGGALLLLFLLGLAVGLRWSRRDNSRPNA